MRVLHGFWFVELFLGLRVLCLWDFGGLSFRGLRVWDVELVFFGCVGFGVLALTG